MKKYERRLVEILWIDPEAVTGWDVASVPSTKRTIISIGWFIGKNEIYTSIAADYDAGNHHFNRVMNIPNVCIEGVWDIEVR